MPETSPVPALATDPASAGNEADNSADVDFVEQVEQVIAKIRPAIQADNGDIFLRGADPDEGRVAVELVGACVSCPASSQTLKAGIERIMKARVPGVTEVVNVGETRDDFMSETVVSL